MEDKKKKKAGFGKAVMIGAETVGKTAVKEVKKYIKNTPEREKLAHENKLKQLEKKRLEMEAENKVMKLSKAREKLRPKEETRDKNTAWQSNSKDMDKMWDNMI